MFSPALLKDLKPLAGKAETMDSLCQGLFKLNCDAWYTPKDCAKVLKSSKPAKKATTIDVSPIHRRRIEYFTYIDPLLY